MGSDIRAIRVLGLIGSVIQLALAALLGGIASRPDVFPNPPEPIPRGLALGLLYALPAAIGALGAMGGRRPLLAAAATLLTVGSVLTFSGVTLVFLVPAIVFGAAAGATSENRPLRRPSRLALVLMTLAIVAVVVAALRIGIFALPVLLLLVLGLERWRAAGQRRTVVSPAIGAVVLAIGVVVLGISAGWSLLSMTETRCWKAYQTPSGVEYRSIVDPGTGPITLGRDAIAGGCDSGALTGQGASTASALGLAAIALAAAAVRRRGSARLSPPTQPQPSGSQLGAWLRSRAGRFE
jgi:hypothetical protein